MTKGDLIVRSVDKRIYREFKSQAAREGITLGKAISLAMLLWTERERESPRTSILQLKPVHYKSRSASRDIDKELYGG